MGRLLNDVNLVGVSNRDWHGSHSLNSHHTTHPELMISLYDKLGVKGVKKLPREVYRALVWDEMGYCLDAPSLLPSGGMVSCCVGDDNEDFPMLGFVERVT